MDRIARASTDERRLVFEAAAQRMALARAVVEKDAVAGLASWVANIRAAADEMATHIADMLMHMGGD